MRLRVDGLARRYGRRWALANVTFELASGSVLMVAGRNGSGKSTLLRLLATAMRPDLGTATVGDFDLVRERADVRRVTALLGHHSYLYDALTARENLEVFAEHAGRNRAIAPALLERVGLGPRAGDAVATFSAGMKKRLSFARLLLQQPRLALLDEPYGQLDPAGFVMVDELVASMRADGITVVMATHQWERVSKLADRALLLDSGQLVWAGGADEAALPMGALTAEPAAGPGGGGG